MGDHQSLFKNTETYENDAIVWYNTSQPRLEISSAVFLGLFAKLRKTTTGFVMSVRPHGTNQLPLEGF
jgi:hypothetical protein